MPFELVALCLEIEDIKVAIMKALSVESATIIAFSVGSYVWVFILTNFAKMIERTYNCMNDQADQHLMGKALTKCVFEPIGVLGGGFHGKVGPRGAEEVHKKLFGPKLPQGPSPANRKPSILSPTFVSYPSTKLSLC